MVGAACAVANRTRWEMPLVHRPTTPVGANNGSAATTRVLKNARLLTYAGWGHCAMPRNNACVVGHMVRYLATGALPPEGTICPANPNPFLPVVAAGAATDGSRVPAAAGLPAVTPDM